MTVCSQRVENKNISVALPELHSDWLAAALCFFPAMARFPLPKFSRHSVAIKPILRLYRPAPNQRQFIHSIVAMMLEFQG